MHRRGGAQLGYAPIIGLWCLRFPWVLAKEVEEGIWLVSFMDCDLGYVRLEEKTLQALDNPFGPKV